MTLSSQLGSGHVWAVFWHFQMKYGLKWKTHQGVRWSGPGKNIVLCEFSGYNQEGEGILLSLEKYGQILFSEKHYETLVSSPWRNCWRLYHIYLVCMCTRSLSCVRLFETPWTIAHQVLLSMGFPRQESWSRLPFPPPGDLPNQGIWIWVSYIGRWTLSLSHVRSPSYSWTKTQRTHPMCVGRV